MRVDLLFPGNTSTSQPIHLTEMDINPGRRVRGDSKKRSQFVRHKDINIGVEKTMRKR